MQYPQMFLSLVTGIVVGLLAITLAVYVPLILKVKKSFAGAMVGFVVLFIPIAVVLGGVEFYVAYGLCKVM